MEVVVELGVPLLKISDESNADMKKKRKAYGISDGVVGSEGGGGRFMRVGVVILNAVFSVEDVVTELFWYTSICSSFD